MAKDLFTSRLSLFLFIVYLLFGVYIHLYFFNLNALPSPIYGGDYYYQLGNIYHILYGGDPFASSSYLNAISGYLPLYSIIVSIICYILHINPISSMYLFSLLIYIASTCIIYYITKKFFSNDYLSLLSILLFNPIFNYPILKYTEFTLHILIPLFVYFLYMIYSNYKKLNYRIIFVFSLIYGLLSISHTVAFVGASIIMLLFGLYIFIRDKDINYIISNIHFFILFCIISVPIILLYWYKPLFVYHLHSRNNMLIWNINIDLFTFHNQLSFFINIIFKYFLNFSNYYNIIFTLLFIISVYLQFSNKFNHNNFFIMFLFFSILLTFSYFLTIPILKTHFVPNYLAKFYLRFSLILFIIYSLSKIKLDKIYILFLIVLLFISSYLIYMSNLTKVQKYLHLPDYLLDVQNYLLSNSNVNDVILSTKELSFSLNALTGRKLVTTRWAQNNNLYINYSCRDRDAAIILYGNKDPLFLIKKYNISYVFWDYYWVNSEYSLVNNNIYPYDPLIVYDNKYNRQILEKYNIKYLSRRWWIDPSMHNTRMFDLLFISPENYYSLFRPWSDNLNKYLTKVWEYKENNKTLAILYKINY